MLAGELLHQLLERRAGGAVAGIPADAEAAALEVADQPLDILVDDVLIGGEAMTLAPFAGGGDAAKLLDFVTVDGAAVEQHLEAVVFGRVVTAGHLDAAADAKLVGRIIEHRARPHADTNDVDAAFGQAGDQCRFQVE